MSDSSRPPPPRLSAPVSLVWRSEQRIFSRFCADVVLCDRVTQAIGGRGKKGRREGDYPPNAGDVRCRWSRRGVFDFFGLYT